MSEASLNREIVAELQAVTGDKTLRLKHVMEWNTGDIKAQEGETVVHLPVLQINVAYKK